MKTFLPQIIGVAAAGPGMGAVQSTFSVVLNFSGRPFSVEAPLKFGPRQCGQFSARAVSKLRTVTVEIKPSHRPARSICGLGYTSLAWQTSRFEPVSHAVRRSLRLEAGA